MVFIKRYGSYTVVCACHVSGWGQRFVSANDVTYT